MQPRRTRSPPNLFFRHLRRIARSAPTRQIAAGASSGRKRFATWSTQSALTRPDDSFRARKRIAQLSRQKNLSGMQLLMLSARLAAKLALTASLGPLKTSADFFNPSLALNTLGSPDHRVGEPKISHAALRWLKYCACTSLGRGKSRRTERREQAQQESAARITSRKTRPKLSGQRP